MSRNYLILTIMVAVFAGCLGSSVANNKDLDDNMLDIRMYHDNLGLYLRNKDADYALWLLTGMDSTLQVISAKFPTHRKLSRPFDGYYRSSLRKPIADIRKALEKQDFPSAVNAYRLLTKKCNGCHLDNDVEKEVIDNTLPQ